MSKSSVLRITREIADLQISSDLSLAVAFREDDVRDVRALIIGPADTPYEFGFFEFRLRFPNTYPTEAPRVKSITTNGGRSRFNPNIYANGKVCLSILGTWRGEKGEEWSTAQGLESILISIQSLMSSNPYENEPGHEGASIADPEAQEYASKIQHDSLRITVIQRLEQLLQISDKDDPVEETLAGRRRTCVVYDPSMADQEGESEPWDPSTWEANTGDELDDIKYDPFQDLYKQRFLWYYDVYLATIENGGRKNVKEGKPFPTAVFEYHSNVMHGKYMYKSLAKRLKRIRAALDDEVVAWANKGLEAEEGGCGIAFNLRNQLKQHRLHYDQSTSPVELTLIDNNPFVWNLTFFGKAETDLYGATINVRITFSTNFPEEQPRVVVLTPLFHHRISKTGNVLCYFPKRPDNVCDHIESIMASIEDEHPAYDPRTLVNPDAATLLWGKEDEKKIYRRKLRRSVQESMENMDTF